MKKFIYFFLVLISFEFFCKFFIGLGDPPLSRKHPTIEYEFVPNQDIKRFHRTIKINSHGMRSNDLKKVKPNNEKRILVFGDSVIWGGSLIDQKDLATEILKEIGLKEGFTLEVGNVSAGSWGPGNWLEYIKERGNFSADIVVLVISSHDWNDNPSYKSNDLVIDKPISAFYELITRYLIPKIKNLSKNLNSNNLNKENFKKEFNKEEFKGLKDLSDFIDIVRKEGSEISVVQFWDKEEYLSGKVKGGNIAIKKILNSKNISPIQSIDFFKSCSKDPKQLFTDSIHPFTKLGQRCLSRVIFEAIKNNLK